MTFGVAPLSPFFCMECSSIDVPQEAQNDGALLTMYSLLINKYNLV